MFEDFKKLFKHTLIYGSGVIVSKAIGFLLIPLYTRCLMPKDYGVVELLDTTTYFVGVLISMGISAAIFRYYYTYDTPKEKNSVISSAFVMVGIMNIAITVPLLLCSRFVSSAILGSPSFFYFVILSLISNAFDIQNGVVMSYMQVQKKSTLYTFISLCRLFIALVLNVVFIVNFKMGVHGILLSALISAGLSFLCLFVYTARKVGFSFSKTVSINMVHYSLPLVPDTIFMLILHFADRYFLKMYVPLEVIGIYSLGYKFGFIIQFLITGPFNRAWGPYRFELYKNNKAGKFYPRILTYYCLGAVTFCLILSIFIRDILKLLVGPAFQAAYKVVPIVSLAYVFLGLSYILESGIFIKKNTYPKAIATGISSIVCIAANLALIPYLGMLGSAWATLISFVVLAGLVHIFASRELPLRYEWPRVIKIFFCGTVTYSISRFISSENILILLLLKSITIAIFFAMLYIFNFFNKEELKKLHEIFTDKLLRVKASLCMNRI